MGLLVKLYNQKQKWDFGTPKTSKLRKLQFWNYLISIFESWISDFDEILVVAYLGREWSRSHLQAKFTIWKTSKPHFMLNLKVIINEKSEIHFENLKDWISPNFGENEQETVQLTEMGLLWKVAGSFSLKWEFVKMGIWTTFVVSKNRNGIPFYREHPVHRKRGFRRWPFGWIGFRCWLPTVQSR